MSCWGEIKNFVNNKIGKDDFESIDKTLSYLQSSILPFSWESSIDSNSIDLDTDINVIYKQMNIPTSDEDINIKSYVDGWVGLVLQIYSAGTVYVYVNDTIVWEVVKPNNTKLKNPIKVKKGDIIKLVFSETHTVANIWIYSKFASKLGLREIE